MAATDDTCSTTEVVRSTGATVRQLGYWVRIGAIPGVPLDDSGRYRRWTPRQVDQVRSILAAIEVAEQALHSVGLNRTSH